MSLFPPPSTEEVDEALSKLNMAPGTIIEDADGNVYLVLKAHNLVANLFTGELLLTCDIATAYKIISHSEIMW